ncbi:hypothetical protein Tco_1164905 [Tanacetum coccineum]
MATVMWQILSTLIMDIHVLSILNRDDICAIYQLVMNRCQDETPEGFDKILWGDLIIMINQSGNDDFLECTTKLEDETEEDSTMALELIRFVKKQIAELEPKDFNGNEKDILVLVLRPHNKWSSVHHA